MKTSVRTFFTLVMVIAIYCLVLGFLAGFEIGQNEAEKKTNEQLLALNRAWLDIYNNEPLTSEQLKQWSIDMAEEQPNNGFEGIDILGEVIGTTSSSCNTVTHYASGGHSITLLACIPTEEEIQEHRLNYMYEESH